MQIFRDFGSVPIRPALFLCVQAGASPGNQYRFMQWYRVISCRCCASSDARDESGLPRIFSVTQARLLINSRSEYVSGFLRVIPSIKCCSMTSASVSMCIGQYQGGTAVTISRTCANCVSGRSVTLSIIVTPRWFYQCFTPACIT